MNQPKASTKRYKDLMLNIENGVIKIPKFQREFVWSLAQTANLLDSILKGYPIGTFILWETFEKLNNIKEIGNLKLNEMPEGYKIQYILDGQQRITSLYAVYCGAKIQKEGEKKITDYKDIFVDLEKDIYGDDQIITDEKPKGDYISLYKLLNYPKFYDEIDDNYSREVRKKINNYFNFFESYDFATITLTDERVSSAIEVFTRINTGGQKLTLFEIISAKTYDESQNFDMVEKFNNFLQELSNSKYETISNSIVLNLISLLVSKNGECKRSVILDLDKQLIIDNWEKAIESIKASIDYFRSVYRIPVSALLPYDSLLVPFGYFFFKNSNKEPNSNQRKYLEEFFWRMSLSYRYSSSTESKLAQDIKRIDDILNGNRPNYDDIKVYLNSPLDIINTSFSAGSSYSKAILCLLAYHEPKNFNNFGKVNLDNSNLRQADSKNYHHFFPKAFLKSKNIGNENSIVNITLVSDDLNRNKIRAKSPSRYIGDFYLENDKIDESLKSHLIIDKDKFGIESDDYNIFLKNRAQTIFNELNDRINLNTDKSGTNFNDIKELILIGENENLEFKSTLRFDLKTFQVNKKLEFACIKTISAFLNSDGGILLIGVDDEGNILGLENDYSTLSKNNKDGFELHLRGLIQKMLGEPFENHIKISFPIIENIEICKLHVMKSSKPTFINFEGSEDFYVRNGNSSIPKDRRGQSEYQKLNFN